MACDYDEKYIIFSLLEIFVIIYIYIYIPLNFYHNSFLYFINSSEQK